MWLWFGFKLRNIARRVFELKENNPVVRENFMIQMREIAVGFIAQYIAVGRKANFMETHMTGLLDLLVGKLGNSNLMAAVILVVPL